MLKSTFQQRYREGSLCAKTGAAPSASAPLRRSHSSRSASRSISAGTRFRSVSAGAKIPIVPVENAATPEVLTRTDSGSRGGTACAQGKRRGRDQRVQATRLEHSGDQSLIGLRPGDDCAISVEASQQADIR